MFTPGAYRVAVDLLRVRDDAGKVTVTLSWGDRVHVTASDAAGATVDLGQGRSGKLRRPPQKALIADGDAKAPKVLKLDFVDVQQGDAAVLETAAGTTMLIDGGEEKLLARYLAARYRGTSAAAPKPVACVVVSHGDADHYSGLTEIQATEVDHGHELFLAPARIFHNGLVKGPGSLKDVQAFGATEQVDGRTVIVDLCDDLRTVDTKVMNLPFRRWRKAIEAWAKRAPVAMRRLQRGDDAAFDFLRPEGVDVKVLGPITVKAGVRDGLPFLSAPKAGDEDDGGKPGAPSASHTINGHSVVLLVTFGEIRFLLAGDLNAEAEQTLVADHDAGGIALTAEVLKVPHHGSADYSPRFLERVAPAVSVVSSGDEKESKEYIHPRATLLGALGRHARKDLAEPVVFITELAAFFRVLGPVTTADHKTEFGFARSAFGIVHTRTDGKRLLVYTDSGKSDQKEAYAFALAGGKLAASPIVLV